MADRARQEEKDTAPATARLAHPHLSVVRAVCARLGLVEWGGNPNPPATFALTAHCAHRWEMSAVGTPSSRAGTSDSSVFSAVDVDGGWMLPTSPTVVAIQLSKRCWSLRYEYVMFCL